MGRKLAREKAFQMLFQKDLGNDSPEAADALLMSEEMKEKDQIFSKSLFLGVQENLETIDTTLERHLQNWQLDRIGKVEKNILRLAAYEMIYREDMPIGVTINEALELAKIFGEADAYKLINGVLDSLKEEKKEE